MVKLRIKSVSINKSTKGPRKNGYINIQAKEVRLIGLNGQQMGIMSPRYALAIAHKIDMDLVATASFALPPVCSLLNYGKYMYDKSKNKKSSVALRLKEVKFRVSINQHDLKTKLRHAEEFLERGSKLKITLLLRGREYLQHKNLGFEIMNSAITQLSNIGNVDSPPRMVGRTIILVMSPMNKKQNTDSL